MIWVILSLILLPAVLTLVWPFLRPAAPERRHVDQGLGVYRQQLDELAADVAGGRMSKADADTMEVEIKRRMLRLGRTAGKPSVKSENGKAYRPVALFLAIAVPVACIGLYLDLGSPDKPSLPLASRDIAAERLALQQQDAGALVQRLVTALKEQPENLDGWILLATTLSRMERYEQAAETFLKATILAPNAAELFVSAGENFYFAAEGHVSDAAAAAFEKAYEIDPLNPGARYYLALREAQGGDTKAALDAWVALYRDSPAEAPFMPVLKNRIEQTAAETGTDLGDLLVDKETIQSGPGPTREDIANAANMTPEDRQAMITSMVEGLAARMAETPDYAGLMRLGQVYGTLGEHGKAADAYARARELRPDDLAALQNEAFAHVQAAGKNGIPPASAVDLYRDVLARDPAHPQALWYLGVAEAAAGKQVAARGHWTRLLSATNTDSPLHQAATEAIKNLSEANKN
tara:strand:- start:30329 stop:31720 length:1392 start_codon:yes stop_codon:yes gene_type:complete